MSDLHRTAYHEAGHAVCARVIGLPCGDAGIGPDHSGYSWTGPAWPAEKIAVCWAGLEAEIARFGTVDLDGIGGDIERIERLARYSDISDGHVSRLRAQVRALLHQHWHHVEAVADRLLAQRVLSAAQLDQMMGMP